MYAYFLLRYLYSYMKEIKRSAEKDQDEKYDIVTFKHVKNLFHQFNNFRRRNCLLQLKIKLTQIIKADLGIKTIQQKNGQYYTERMFFYSNFEHILFTSTYISDLPTKLIRDVIENRHVCKKFQTNLYNFYSFKFWEFFYSKISTFS